MRSRGLTPSALRPLATRLVLISSSAKLVWRPSNSKAMASPRVFARARSMSARFAGSWKSDMLLPVGPFFVLLRHLFVIARSVSDEAIQFALDDSPMDCLCARKAGVVLPVRDRSG